MKMRLCPVCGCECDLSKLHCMGSPEEPHAPWDMLNEDIRDVGWRPAELEQQPAPPPIIDNLCPNGHVFTPGDFFCPECNAPIGDNANPGLGEVAQPPITGYPVPPPHTDTSDETSPDAAPYLSGTQTEPTTIGHWQVERTYQERTDVYAQFVVRHTEEPTEGLLTLYCPDQEPDPTIYELWRNLDRDHVAVLLDVGRFEDQPYDVTELLSGGTLADLPFAGPDITPIRPIVHEIGKALHAFAEAGLRHRDLKPEHVHVRSIEPLDLVIAEFGSARHSKFDLDIVSPLETTAYTAPEAAIGAVSPTSDWWSLGVILLQQITQGMCFEDINPKAFLMHAMAGGVQIPKDIPDELSLILRGLLANDRGLRWNWEQVTAWLAGETVTAPEAAEIRTDSQGPEIGLNGSTFRNPGRFALAAAHAENWDAGLELLQRGELATWAAECNCEPDVLARLRRIVRADDLSDDLQLMCALKALNDNIPLTIRGDIIIPGWLSRNPGLGYELISGPIVDIVGDSDRTARLSELRERERKVRTQAKQLEIGLVEDVLRVWVLVTSRALLEQHWESRREELPDSPNASLATLIERPARTEIDLILLLSADASQFRTTDEVLNEAHRIATRGGVSTFDRTQATEHIRLPQSEMRELLRNRSGDLARCGIERADEWIEEFRLERRLPLVRALALLAVPADAWHEPPRNEYYKRLLEFFEKKVTVSLSRGPLVRMTIGKTTPRIDLQELDTPQAPANALLETLLQRKGNAVNIAPAAFGDPESTTENRLRRLERDGTLYQRDTGIDGRYLGYPFLLWQKPDSTTLPRIAPVLLWPIAIQMAAGRHTAALAFDKNREEVRLNPALESLLGKEEIKRWKDIRHELLERAALTPGDVMDAFSNVVPEQKRDFTRLPGKDVRVEAGKPRLLSSAVLFQLTYAGQAIVDDMRRLQARPPDDTALANLLRLNEVVEDAPRREAPAHGEHFFTSETDPSQEAAVNAARTGPGVLLEGPPGTGKSQTIVNAIMDGIGNNKTVLVVCQKQAALEIVRKRLERDGLGHRFVMVTDMNRDRRPVLRDVREQASAQRQNPIGTSQAKQVERIELLRSISRLEGELDQRHHAIHTFDETCGRSYRALLGELIALEAADGKEIEYPALRDRLDGVAYADLDQIADGVASVATLWFESGYEDSPLTCLKPFTGDRATTAAFSTDFEAFRQAESQRWQSLQSGDALFEIDDPGATRKWVQSSRAHFTQLQSGTWLQLAQWGSLFSRANAPDGLPSSGATAIETLSSVLNMIPGLMANPTSGQPPTSNAAVRAIDDRQLTTIRQQLERALRSAKWYDYITPGRFLARRACTRFATDLQIGGDINDLAVTIDHEARFRPLRQQVNLIRNAFGISARDGDVDAPNVLAMTTSRLRTELQNVRTCATHLDAAPRPDVVWNTVRQASPQAFERTCQELERAALRCEKRRDSHAALQTLAKWMDGAWCASRNNDIALNVSASQGTENIAANVHRIASFQQFRSRAESLSPEVRATLSILRTREDRLAQYDRSDLADQLGRIVRREGRLAWKARIEQDAPALHLKTADLNGRVARLSKGDQRLRQLNASHLASNIRNDSILGTIRDWQAMTRLNTSHGVPRSSIRDLLDKGRDQGLFAMRPIWLMNPDVASRILPLTAGLFDVVIFDEASQMPVEYALPALYRAKSAIVSGDDKQMPPTSFFSSQFEDEEETDPDTIDADGSTGPDEDTVNRREIKDCPDLLHLARGALAPRTLDVHYRSEWRELISFSNAAFYGDRLNVPLLHPDSVVTEAQPIEVIEVNGTYHQRTNTDEATRVVELLAEYWSKPQASRPSIGVVTFNKDQANLINDELNERAEIDDRFRLALEQERTRTQDQEDIGFFVKNVENVQGDERDVIIFSTTFGRTRQGQFRRYFGVLGQKGGRRRLNVAITRAKQKVVLVTSIPVDEVSDMLSTQRPPAIERDYLQGYLAYARRVAAGDLDGARRLCARMVGGATLGQGAGPSIHDGFVRSVSAFLNGLGHAPIAPEGRDAFAVDLVLGHPTGTGYALGIECDAPDHPLLECARAREIWRPGVISGTVPHLHRIACRDWFEDRGTEQQRLRNAIAATMSPRAAPSNDHELVPEPPPAPTDVARQPNGPDVTPW